MSNPKFNVGDKVKLSGTAPKGVANPTLTVTELFAEGELCQVTPSDHLASNQLWIEDLVAA